MPGVRGGRGCEELGVEEAVAGLRGAAQGSDLELLGLVDPRDLPDDLARLAYVGALDRVVALAASLRAQALVALGGERPGGDFLAEVHLEHEVAVARRTSRYAAGRSVEQARCLATVFPGFAAALRGGRVGSAADGSCTWTTGWGQQATIPPRPYLDDPPGATSDAEADLRAAYGAIAPRPAGVGSPPLVTAARVAAVMRAPSS